MHWVYEFRYKEFCDTMVSFVNANENFNFKQTGSAKKIISRLSVFHVLCYSAKRLMPQSVLGDELS